MRNKQKNVLFIHFLLQDINYRSFNFIGNMPVYSLDSVGVSWGVVKRFEYLFVCVTCFLKVFGAIILKMENFYDMEKFSNVKKGDI